MVAIPFALGQAINRSMNDTPAPEKKILIDYCPFECPRKHHKIFFCMKRYFKVIEKYCPLFEYTEEERNKVFEEMKKQV